MGCRKVDERIEFKICYFYGFSQNQAYFKTKKKVELLLSLEISMSSKSFRDLLEPEVRANAEAIIKNCR